jgi:Spy/CpxP family protein refolding chaperone
MPLAEELALADRRIAEVEDHILGQHQLIARLAADGLDTSMAKALLKTMYESRDALRAHRQCILAKIVGKRPE